MPELKLYTPGGWEDYELIDTGGLEKLERFGKYILTRPEPQAVWEKSMPRNEWERLSHATYTRTRGIDPARSDSSDKGEWKRKPGVPDQWVIKYSYKGMTLSFRLGFTAFGHIGVFPEQAVNWEYLYDSIKGGVPSSKSAVGSRQSADSSRQSADSSRQSAVGSRQSVVSSRQPADSESKQQHFAFRVLNLFAYTGGSSLAAKAAGADVVHVDSVKPVIQWAKDDMELSGLRDIRWVVEDALKFVRREVKRGNSYSGIIIDPPAYGRGPEGEKWVLQESINEMISLCSKLLTKQDCFLVMSLYSMGFSPLISESLVKTHFGDVPNLESGELFFHDRDGRSLPLGTFLRFDRRYI